MNFWNFQLHIQCILSISSTSNFPKISHHIFLPTPHPSSRISVCSVSSCVWLVLLICAWVWCHLLATLPVTTLLKKSDLLLQHSSIASSIPSRDVASGAPLQRVHPSFDYSIFFFCYFFVQEWVSIINSWKENRKMGSIFSGMTNQNLFLLLVVGIHKICSFMGMWAALQSHKPMF